MLALFRGELSLSEIENMPRKQLIGMAEARMKRLEERDAGASQAMQEIENMY